MEDPSGRGKGSRRWRAGRFLVPVLAAVGLLLLLGIFGHLGPGGNPTETAFPRPREAPTFRGRILRADGTPAAGAAIEADGIWDPCAGAEPFSCGRAGPGGEFSIPPPPNDGVLLRMRATLGHLATEVDLSDAEGQAIVDMTLRLPATVPVEGIVIAAEDGRPLEGMEVRLGERVVRTNRLGRFRFLEIPGDAALPEVVVSGAGRKTLRRALPASGGLDDLLLSVEGE